MAENIYRQRAQELLTLKDPSNPQIPDLEDGNTKENTQALISYWTGMLISEKEGVRKANMPYRYLHDDEVINDPSLIAHSETLDVGYFQTFVEDINSGVEFIDEKEQIIAQAACITDLKTIPSRYIYSDETEEDGAADKHNFMPRNYDRSQITSLHLGEMVKVRAHYTDPEGLEWLFVTGLGGVFGWTRAEDLYLNGNGKTVDEAISRQYPENPRGLTVAHINVPFLQIGDEVTEVTELRTRLGLTLGSRIYGYQEGEHFIAKLPVKRGRDTVLEEVRIPLKYVVEGYKDPKELVQDLLKLLSNPYAWGGNAVWRRGEENPIYGLNDCSGIIRQVLKMYGIDLPANDSAQMRMGEVLVENKVKGKRKKLTNKQINQFLHGNYTPGLTFFAYGGHIAIVISAPGQPLQLLHARFHRRVDRGKYGQFRATNIEPLDLDRVVVTGSKFVDPQLFPDADPNFDFRSRPIAIWHLPVE